MLNIENFENPIFLFMDGVIFYPFLIIQNHPNLVPRVSLYRSEETLERAVIMAHYRGRAIRFVQFRANISFVVSLSPVEKDEKNVFDLRNSLGAGALSLIYDTHFNSKHK